MPVIFHSGLWEFCQSSSASTAGISTAGFCQAFATPITYMDDMASGQQLIVARFLMITACVCIAFAWMTGVVSDRNINLIREEELKKTLSIISGVLFLSCALCTAVATIYEAAIIAAAYHPEPEWVQAPSREPFLQYTFGRDVYLGWVSAFTAMCVGLLMLELCEKRKQKSNKKLQNSETSLLNEFI